MDIERMSLVESEEILTREREFEAVAQRIEALGKLNPAMKPRCDAEAARIRERGRTAPERVQK